MHYFFKAIIQAMVFYINEINRLNTLFIFCWSRLVEKLGLKSTFTRNIDSVAEILLLRLVSVVVYWVCDRK